MCGHVAEHVVEKANAGVDLVLTAPVQVEAETDVRFVGLAVDFGSAHGSLQFG